MPFTGTTFSWLSAPNCGVSIMRPVRALIATDMPPWGEPIHSSPVKYHGTPLIVSIVEEQKYSYRSVPSMA